MAEFASSKHRDMLVHSDGRTWRQAELERQPGPWTWHWQLNCEFPPGPVTITARAWDTSAAVQPESAAQLCNPKGYVNNSRARVRITAR